MKITEADWQRRVMDTAALHGWRCAHFRPAPTRSGRWATPVSGDVGFPDLVLARAGQVLCAELKSDTGRPTAEQLAWLAALTSATGWLSLQLLRRSSLAHGLGDQP